MFQHPSIHCPGCGKPNAPDAKFCNECAKPIPEGYSLEPVWQPVSQVDCPSCRSENPSTNELCFACSKPLLCEAYLPQTTTPASVRQSLPTSADPNSLGYRLGAWWAKRSGTNWREIAGIAFLTFLVSFTIVPWFQSGQSISEPEGSTHSGTPAAPILAGIAPQPKEQTAIAVLKAPELRDQLLTIYQTKFFNANPHLNYIETKITKEKNGYGLWLVHSTFTDTTFDVGNDVHTVNAWIHENRLELQRAKVVKVGLENERADCGACWLETQ
jgi:hypothetical protein